MVSQSGYSGTPLPKKLGLKDGQRACFVAIPDEHAALRHSANFHSIAGELEAHGRYDFVHLFVKARAELERQLPLARETIAQSGMIWVSWPKKASKLSSDITEDIIREIAFPLDLVDVKVCAVDSIWSGLKLVIRKEKRRAAD